jgi:type II secretory pathway component GspD/PulD (secretin)
MKTKSISLIAALGLLASPLAQAQTPPITPTAKPAAPDAAKPGREIVVSGQTTTAVATNAPARNIRFQFEGIPYTDVLERFAQMSGKPLLSDTNIVGSLSYNDPTPYTFPEAIETLNLILSMKGVMLLDTGNQLRLVPFKDLRSLPLPILRGTDPTGDVRPGDVVSVVLDLGGLDAREVAESVTPMLSNAGAVAPLGRGRRLVITDRLANIQRVRALLATIDTQESTERQMRTFTLLNASGAIISDLLNRTFGIVTAPKRTSFNPNTKAMEVLPPDPKDYITAVYDEASRTLVLFGPDDRLALAEQLINKFEQKDGVGGDVRIYYPQTVKADELANIIRQAIPAVAGPNETAANAATKARVISDTAQNRLIVAAPIPGQLEQIEQLISRVDKGAIGGTSTGGASNGNVPNRSSSVQLTRIFRPRSAEATNVASILTQALTRKSPNGQPSTTASISVDTTSQSVVVSGTLNDVQVAADIVSQLETGSTQPTALQTRFIEVGSADEAKRILPLVEQLYRSQTAAGSSSSAAHARILADPDSGRLIVTASEEHLTRIEGLVRQLRAEKADPQPRKLKVFALAHSRTDVALPAIQSLLNERLTDRRFNSLPKPSLVSDAPNNRLLVTATDDQLREIEQIVAIVDTAPEQVRRDLTIIPLSTKPAAEVIPLVTQLLGQLRTPNGEPPTLISDPTGKQILVLAGTNDLERIRTLVRQFDTSPATSAPRGFKAIELGSRTATELGPLVQQLYAEQIKGQPEPAGGPATVLVEAKQNRLMVSGSDKEIARVEAIIRQLDPAESKAAKEETRVFRLRTASATELASLIEKSVNAQGQMVRVILDARSNSLVVSGDKASVEQAGQIIQQLDTRNDAGPREFRILDLKSSDATSITPTLNTLFTELLRDQRGPEFISTTKITADPSGNRILVTGPREEIEQVSSLLTKLDNAPQQAPGARVFKLAQSDAVMMAPIVTSAMMRYDVRGNPIRRVTVTADEKSNSLVVSGTRSDLQDAESVIEKLDNDSGSTGTTAGSRERILKIFEVKSDADALAALATKIFTAQNPRATTSPVSITPEPASKRLIVMAPANLMAQVEQVITSLDTKPEQANRELHPIELKNVTASEILPRIQSIYTEQSAGKTLKPATLYPDPSGARILVQGTAEQAASIKQIADTLAAPARPARETRVFDLGRLTEASRVLPLAQQLYRDQLNGSPELGPPDAQFITDSRTGRIIVSARADQMTHIAATIERLQGNVGTASPSRETRTVEVGTPADAQRIAPLVQQLYTDQWKDRSESDPADAQIVADPRTGRVIITGKPDHLKQIEAILQQLGTGKASSSSRETRILDLTTANAVELATTVRTLYTEQAKSRLGNTPPDTLITPDGGANRLILVGETNELAAIEDIVRKLDKVSNQSASTRVFKIKSAEPEKIAEILSTALVRYDAYGRPQKRTTVSVDAKTRTLIVTGDPKELQGVSGIIDQLDQSLGAQADRRMKVVTLTQGRATALTPKVRQLLTDRVKSQPELGTAEVLILEDADSNQLILAGSEQQLAVVEQIISELQSAQTARSARETRMIELASAEELSRLQPLVQQLYQDRSKNNPSDPPDAVFVADPRNARLIVTARTNHLAEIEGILAQLRGNNSAPQPRDTRIIDLTTANAAELATTVRTLYTEQARNRPGAPAADSLILADSGANRLIVTAATNELSIIEDIVRKLDKVSNQSGTTRVFKIKSAEPDKVAEILTSGLVRYDAYGRPQKRVTVSVDAKTRTLIVTGDPKELQGVSSIIDQLDQSLGTQEERRMKVVTLTQGRASTLSPKVRQLFNDRVKSQPELGTAEILIIEDADSNQLILAGSEKQLTLVEQIVSDLQAAQTATAARETRFIELGSAEELTRLQPLVQQLYQVRSTNNPTDRPDAMFVADTRNARLIVTARTNHLAEIERIITQLRGEGGSLQARETRVIDLTTANASELALTVRTLYTEQAKTRPGAPAADTLILPDNGANRIIVTAATNELVIVEDIIRKLDKVSAQSASTRIVKLKSADPEKVAEILATALVRYDAFGRPQKRVTVTVDAKTRTLITTGDPKELQAATAIIEQLDQSLGNTGARSMRVVPLRQRRATEITAKVRQIFQDQSRSNPELGTTEALILDDTASNQLVLAGSEAQLNALASIIEALEKGADNATRTTRLLNLEHASAAAVSSLLTQLYVRPPGTDPNERVSVNVGSNDRSLVIDAPNVAFEKIEALVKSLDEPEAGSNGVVQSVRLTKGRAEEIAAAVNRTMTNRPGFNPANRVTITPVLGANSILLNGPTNAVQDVLRIVRELDAEGSSGEIEVRVYKLENGSAKEVSVILQQLLQTVSRRRREFRTGGTDGGGGGGGGGFGLANVTIDDRSNSLIVTGTKEHFVVVDKILPTLDKAPERADRDVQFVWLRKARAFDVSSKLEALFEDRPRRERPVIEPDLTNNSITIIGRKSDLIQIQDLVGRLDEQGKDSSYQVRLRTLDRVAAEQMARLLENIYPQTARTPLSIVEKISPPEAGATNNPTSVTVAIDREANALVLAGPVADLDQVERLISDLSFNFYGNEAEFRLFPLKDADPVLVARTLSEVLRQEPVQLPPQQPGQPPRLVNQQPKITVVAEPRTRSVVVRARPTDFTLLESLIKQLDAAGESAQVSFKVFPLQHTQPEKALPLVQSLVTQLNTTRPGDPVTVTLSPRDRGLMVVAREGVITQVGKMIESIDQPAKNIEADVRVFSLKRASAAQLAVALQNLLKPGPQGESTPEARELQEQIRRLNVRTADDKPVSLDLTQPIRISPDPAGTGGNRLMVTSTPDNLTALAAIIDLLDTPAIVEGVRVRFVRLVHADAAAVSQTLNTIFTQGKQLAAGPGGPGAVPESEQGKALVHPLNVATDARSNTLILAGQPETIDLAMKVITDLDQPLERFVTDVRLFRLKHASATRLVPLLQSVFTEGPNVPGTEGLATQITRLRTLREGGDPSKTTETAKTRAALTLQADDVSNILIVAARTEMLPLVEEVITQLDIPSASGLESVRVYPLQFADPGAIQKILTDLFNGNRAANLRNEDKPIISVDARTGSLIVAGSSKSFAILEGLLKQLDQKLAFDLREIRLVPLEHADAAVVSATLQRLMDARVTQRATLNAGSADALKVIIIADTRSNALLVGGGKEGFELVESLAKQLDQASPALSGRIRIIPVVHADARVIATTLAGLFDQRYSASRSADLQRQKPIIIADTRANALLVAASQDDNKTLDELLARLDAKLENPALTLTVIPLKHNDAGRVAPLLEGIFAARVRALTLPGQAPLPSQQIEVQPDPLNNALIISASKENLELIQGLVDKIDAEPSIPGGVFEMFTLQYADAQRVATILRSLVDQGLYRPGLPTNATGPRGRANNQSILSISVDPRSNTLIVSASPENLSIVKGVLQKIDTKDLAAMADVKLYQLRHARASSLATTLEQFFRSKRTADAIAVNANERSLPVAVIPDDRVNTLLVTGGKEAFDLVDRLLPQLDAEGTFSRLNFRVFPLQKATATKLQSTLQTIVANRPPKVKGEPIDPITIVADSWVNALLVGATVDDLDTVASLIQQLDSEPTETGLAIHVFPLAKADARRVAVTVQGLFRENAPNQVLPVTVNADERINALVVSCGEIDARRIGELVKQLDTDQVARVAEIRVFPLEHARAETLSTILTGALNSKPTPLTEQNPNAQSLLQFITRTEGGQELVTAALKEAVLITPDVRMNSLIVSGPVEYMGLLEQIIHRLDASSPQQAKIKVFTLQNADARQMADLLTQLFRMSAAPGSNQRSIQYTLVRSRTDDPNATSSDDEPVASVTLGTAEQNALTVTVDPRTNALLIGGTDHYVTLVSQIIESLDSSSAAERTSEVIRLKNSQAIEVATAIRTFLDQERQRLVQVLGADAVGTGQRMMEREVAVVAEQTSNTLLVSANRRYFEQIRGIIEELDTAQPQVLIQVLLAEVTLDAVGELGIEWNYGGSKGDVNYGVKNDFGVANQVKSLGGFSAAAAGTDFNFLLRALKTDGRLEVLSRPQIVTADNKPATINIGQRIPLITDSRVTPQGDTINSFRYEDVGVNLTVTPKISPDGFVKMELGTTNSALSSSTVEINSSAVVPIINQRRANTTVSVQSGQTIIIGGLISTVDDKRVRKLPLLGDIPYVGALFRSTKSTRERKELLIFLTPLVLANKQEKVPLEDPQKVTQDIIRGSRFHKEIKRDEMQRSIVDPILPPEPPSVAPDNKRRKTPRS